MMYSLKCPWSDFNEKIVSARNLSVATEIFCNMMFGVGWSGARINEANDRQSAIINVKNKRPFKIEVCSLVKRDAEITKTKSRIGKIEVDAILARSSTGYSVGFCASPKSVIVAANEVKAGRKVLLEMMADIKRKKIGFVDISTDEESLSALESELKNAGAQKIFRR
jgi:hypothetical protein